MREEASIFDSDDRVDHPWGHVRQRNVDTLLDEKGKGRTANPVEHDACLRRRWHFRKRPRAVQLSQRKRRERCESPRRNGHDDRYCYDRRRQKLPAHLESLTPRLEQPECQQFQSLSVLAANGFRD
jgi:hypothetical protein